MGGEEEEVSLKKLCVFAAVSFDTNVPAGDEVQIHAEIFILGSEAHALVGGRLGEASRFVDKLPRARQ